MNNQESEIMFFLAIWFFAVPGYLFYRLMTDDSRIAKKLSKIGVVASARIDQLQQTGTMVNRLPVIRIWVTAYPDNQPPVQLVVKKLVSYLSMPKAGDQVTVAFNPEKLEESMLVSREYTEGLAGQNGRRTAIPPNFVGDNDWKIWIFGWLSLTFTTIGFLMCYGLFSIGVYFFSLVLLVPCLLPGYFLVGMIRKKMRTGA